MYLLFLFPSCNGGLDEVYSCDKEINQWVINNRQSIQSLSRVEWLLLPDAQKVPAYRAFTKEQRVNCWLTKINEVLSLSWNDKEKEHIQEITRFIIDHQNLFDGRKLSDEQIEDVELFFYKWQKRSIGIFGWDKDMCIDIAGSALPLRNKNVEFDYIETLPKLQIGIDRKDQDDGECNCSVRQDFCSSPRPCKEGSCSDTYYGCGWLWVASCTGLCGGI